MSELNIPSTGVTFVKFSAEWCGPCKLLDKTFDVVKKENPSINIQKYDIDDNSDLADKYNIASVPTVRVYRDGGYVGKFVGAMPPKFINDVISGTSILDK